jgi:hypothetical protein
MEASAQDRRLPSSDRPVQPVSSAQHGQPAVSRRGWPPADTVRLRFAWTAGTAARIETTRTQRTASSADTLFGRSSYRMHVRPHAEGLVISYDEFEFPPAADTTEAAQLSVLAAQAATMVPRVVVDSAGAFIGIEDVESVRARLDSLMTRMLEPDEAASAREMVESVVTEEGLSGIAAQEWNALVGRWAGADLEIGVDYEFAEEAALPLMAGAVVPMVSTFRVERRTSCGDGLMGSDCVEIRLVSRADPDAMAEILAEFAERLLAVPGMGIAFESFELENSMVLVTESATLRPHRVRTEKGMKGVYSADGQRAEVGQSEVRTYTYTYADGR